MTNMKKLGLEIRLESPHKSVTQEPDGSLTLHLDVGEFKSSKINTDRILLALGRPPCVAGLGLENTDIRTKNGVVIVDEF
jgi:pyruvate/2-oxoglutarate dehydrogenase complex dihydrolipoamide dehydrogenase (E3) component